MSDKYLRCSEHGESWFVAAMYDGDGELFPVDYPRHTRDLGREFVEVLNEGERQTLEVKR